MTGLDIFALIVLLVLLLTAAAGWAMLGYYPGKIARERNHPQAEAISACGWWGAITMGILSPLAFICAFTHPGYTLSGAPKPVNESQPVPPGGAGSPEGGDSS